MAAVAAVVTPSTAQAGGAYCGVNVAVTPAPVVLRPAPFVVRPVAVYRPVRVVSPVVMRPVVHAPRRVVVCR
jgi:hypothetical protein